MFKKLFILTAIIVATQTATAGQWGPFYAGSSEDYEAKGLGVNLFGLELGLGQVTERTATADTASKKSTMAPIYAASSKDSEVKGVGVNLFGGEIGVGAAESRK